VKGQQLPLSVQLRETASFESFFAGPNPAAVEALRELVDGVGSRGVLLYGAGGSGKTHLAQIWAAQSDARIVEAATVTAAGVDALAQGPLCVDDADGVADAAALFHLINLMRERGHSLLLTGRAPPAQWPFSLPDLMSRLKAMPAQGIAAPGDALLGAVLVKLFADRQLAVGEEVVKYLVPRIERSFHAARHWVAALDAAALAESRAVTVALARRIAALALSLLKNNDTYNDNYEEYLADRKKLRIHVGQKKH